jgi:hypothetical protein
MKVARVNAIGPVAYAHFSNRHSRLLVLLLPSFSSFVRFYSCLVFVHQTYNFPLWVILRLRVPVADSS